MKTTPPFPLSLCRSMRRNYLLLSIATAVAALIGTAVTAAALYALTSTPAAEFVIIALLSLVLADTARCQALKQYRTYKLWKNYLADSQLASPSSSTLLTDH